MATCLKLIAGLLVFVIGTVDIAAADIVRGETVTNRQRLDFDAEGLPLGGFRLLPSVKLQFVADDNILASEILILDDLIVMLVPKAELRSDWIRHELNFGADALAARYDDYDNENYTNYKYWTDGRLDIGSSALFGQASHARKRELRTAPNAGSLSPTLFEIDNFALRYQFNPNRFYANLGVELDVIDFDGFRLVGDGNGGLERASNSDRDRTVTDSRLRMGYKVGPGNAMFVEGRYYDIDYADAVDFFGRNRDSEGVDIVGGAELDIAGVTFGEVFFGYRKIVYADSQFATQDGPLLGAKIDWNITRLTTLNLSASQRIFGTTVAGASGIEAVEFALRADHELRRNLLLNLLVLQRDEDFLNIARKDDVTRFEAGFKVLMSKYMELNGGYTYQNRDSNEARTARFSVNQLFVGFLIQI